jgi:cell division septum initiation protein DivIVA
MSDYSKQYAQDSLGASLIENTQLKHEIERLTRELAEAVKIQVALSTQLAEAKQNADRGYLEGYGKGKSDLAEAKALDDRRVMAIEAMIKEKNELERKLVEARALSLEWMACHDKLKAGEPYKFPSPPYDRALIEAHNAAIKDAAKVVEGMSGYVWIVRSETAAAILALVKPDLGHIDARPLTSGD